MKKYLIGLGIIWLLFCGVTNASATTYVYDYTIDGDIVTTNATAAGNTLTVGDVVEATFTAQGDSFWAAQTGDKTWTPISMVEEAFRKGVLSWGFYLDGVGVATGVTDEMLSSSYHITQPIYIGSALNFDQFIWSYSVTSLTNTIASEATSTLGNLMYVYDGQFYTHFDPVFMTLASAPVPEPATMLLFGIGLMGLAGVSRRKKLTK